tara:strand:+ start:237 stop:404 length:168 start_codon:yes stop_codon:yes gene_type:complete
MKLRVVQYYGMHPKTGEMVDVRYNLQQFDGDQWLDVPVIYEEVKIEDREDESKGH